MMRGDSHGHRTAIRRFGRLAGCATFAESNLPDDEATNFLSRHRAARTNPPGGNFDQAYLDEETFNQSRESAVVHSRRLSRFIRYLEAYPDNSRTRRPAKA
jgi:hypothetical protein